MKKKILDIAKTKVKRLHGNKGKEWYGHLTPSEFLALVKAGIRAKSYDIDRAKRWKEKGASDPAWYYFEIGSLELF